MDLAGLDLKNNHRIVHCVIIGTWGGLNRSDSGLEEGEFCVQGLSY